MKTFILNCVSNIKSISKNADLISCIKNAEWIVYNGQDIEVEKFIFLGDDKLLISVNGKSSYFEWKHISINSSLIIDYKKEQYLFKILWCSNELIVLNIDSTNKYCFLINSNSNTLRNTSFENLQWYLFKVCGIDFLSDSQRKQYNKEQKVIRRKIEAEKKEEDKEFRRTSIAFCVLMVFFFCLVAAHIIIEKNKENKMEKPIIYETSAENRNAVDLGLSVKWASCNIGANSPVEEGNYYNWGDTICKGNPQYTKEVYQTLEKKTTLKGEKIPPYSIDIASHYWGKKWRMPTKEEAQELIDKCEIDFTIKDNIHCAKITGPNGNSIYLPSKECVDRTAEGYQMLYECIPIYIWTVDICKSPEDTNVSSEAYVLYLELYEKNDGEYYEVNKHMKVMDCNNAFSVRAVSNY